MADQHEPPSKHTRAAPPPFVGPPRGGALAPKTRADRPTLPPFSPPFLRRPSPTAPVASEEPGTAGTAAPRPTGAPAPPWLDAAPNETTSPVETPGTVAGPHDPTPASVQAATGIDWLDSPAPGDTTSTSRPEPSSEEIDDVFGWDPAEERGATLDAAPAPAAAALDALKELEPWAMPGAEPSSAGSDEIAAALERVAARIRSGDLFVPNPSATSTDEAALAAVLAVLLQRARG